ncbi:MAG: 23S rRNA (pseudouridine(1915)-N(3))-methyltransferase RlmH [Bacteroidetes bacterium]|nr:23S rRNA (pseudouridine(1915)-N(3))-methyltransferase RlmH [Bacteroidota bacterium]
MSILIAAIENHKDQAIDVLCEKYLQRLNGSWKTSLQRLPAARVKEPEKQKQIETETLQKIIKPEDVVLLCDENGKTLTSNAFSALIQTRLANLRGRLIVGIGGSYGFTPEFMKINTCIRLSDMTLPHHLARLLLCEQLYRAMSIQKGSAYHHA